MMQATLSGPIARNFIILEKQSDLHANDKTSAKQQKKEKRKKEKKKNRANFLAKVDFAHLVCEISAGTCMGDYGE